MRTWILKIIEINKFVAWSIWKWQQKLVHFLTDNQGSSIILACGLAGVVYLRKNDTDPQVSSESLDRLFCEIKSRDIDYIASEENIYEVETKEKKVILSNTKGVFSYKVDPNDTRFVSYQKCKQSCREARENLLKVKNDKIKSHDKVLLHKHKKALQAAEQELKEVWENQLTQLIKELHSNEKIQLVHKKFDLYLFEVESLLQKINEFKSPKSLYHILKNPDLQEQLRKVSRNIRDFSNQQISSLSKRSVASKDAEIIIQKNNYLLDSAWAIDKEIIDVVQDVKSLLPISESQINEHIFKKCLAIVCVFRGLDKKLETRGRDSCGLSTMLVLEKNAQKNFLEALEKHGLSSQYQERQTIKDLGNYSIDAKRNGDEVLSIAFTYKVAKAIGQLGDNVKQLRKYLADDPIFSIAVQQDTLHSTNIVHTRWASQGIVSVENCHPVDNKGIFSKAETVSSGIGNIYSVLNGDIDNHLELREKYENDSRKVSDKITTDAKVISLTIERYLLEGHDFEKAFLQAANEFRGSFAIAVHSDMEPGKVYLAQQGKGQGLYVGISPYGYHIASEIYGFVEQTPLYVAMEPGQIFILDENAAPGIENIRAFDFHGSRISLNSSNDLARTPITTRDIFLDSSQHTHFLDKEIHESPEIIEKTTRGKWKEEEGKLKIKLGEEIFPKKIQTKLQRKKYRKILFIGMGTAHAAAEATAAIFRSILGDSYGIIFQSVLATEFTASYSKENRQDHLVIAISQSGGTTDTNAAIRKLAEDHADILGIINKRDSDMSFLTDGVLYTGDGRDVEIAVASTKAFYAQVVAGTIYAVAFSQILGAKEDTVDVIIRDMLQLPQKLRELFLHKDAIAFSANQLAPKHVYWDTLSTGVGTSVAKEIKIKLSELCYMSIPEFCAANKKHINLSAEALILCFLGGIDQQENSSLQKDLQGEISIFLAQKNTPVVFTTTTDKNYDDIIPQDRKNELLLKVIPQTLKHFAVIMNTAAGHLWAYYAAKALNARSQFFSKVLEEIKEQEEILKNQGVESYNITRDKKFHSTVELAYKEYQKMVSEGFFGNGFFAQQAIQLEKLFLLTLGVIPASSSAFLFGEEWGTDTILLELKSNLSYLRSWLARSIDAIKHQAKYITVGATGFEGISNMPSGTIKTVFQNLLKEKHIIAHEDVNEYDMVTLTNIQLGIENVKGGILYNVISDEKDIFLEVISNSRFGDSTERPSRYDEKTLLRGGRKAMALQGNRIHIGKGHDQSNTIIIPIRALGKITKLLVLHFDTVENLEGAEKIKLLGGLNNSNTKAFKAFTIIQENKEEVKNFYGLAETSTDQEFLATLLNGISVEDLLLLPHEDISEKIIATTKSLG